MCHSGGTQEMTHRVGTSSQRSREDKEAVKGVCWEELGIKNLTQNVGCGRFYHICNVSLRLDRVH